MWWRANSKGIHLSWWQSECRWRMWAAVIVRTRCGWVKFRECGELLKEAVHKSYVRLAMLYGSEAWCLKESEMGILRRAERSIVRAISRVQLKDRKRSKDLMLVLGLSETTDQLAMANSVCWYGHVLRREDGHVLSMAFDFEVEGQRKKGRPKRRAEEESVWEAWFEKARCTLLIKVEYWRKSDCCCVEVNLAILTCWGYYQPLNNGVPLSCLMIIFSIFLMVLIAACSLFIHIAPS